MTPEELRATIPALQQGTYLNFGASGPSPRPVVEAAQSFLAHHAYDAPTGEGMYPAAFDSYERVRRVVADFVGARAADVALTQSTTDGINRIAAAIDWEPGDVVVRTDLEHPAGILPWQRLERERGVEVRVVPSIGGRLDEDAYRDAVEDARLVCVSALSWNYGTRLPVARLVDVAHDVGARVLVDAVQQPGQAPLDVSEWGADAVAAAGHKWLLGTWGAGFLHVDSDFSETLAPAAIGYRSVVEPTADHYEYERGAARFEVGTTSPAPYVALETAIELIEQVGVERIERRIERLAARLIDGIPDERLLSPRSPESGIVTIDVDDSEGCVDAIDASGIVVRSLPEPAALRASIHAVSTEEEIDALVGALERSCF